MDFGAPSWWLIQSPNDTPLVFEVKAIEQIHSLLKPALRHVLSALLQAPQVRISRIASKILENLDEIWLFISGLLEAYYLKTWGASFSEHFYGLKRKVPNATDWKPWSSMPVKGLDRAWALLVLFPYLRGKLDHYHEIWTRQERSAMLFGNHGDQSLSGKIRKIFIQVVLLSL